MRRPWIHLTALLLIASLTAAPAMAQPDQAVGQAIVNAIRSGAQAGSAEPFETQLARIENITDQQRYEARAFFAVVTGDADYYHAMEQPRPQPWDESQAFIFESEQQVDAVSHFMKALAARDAGDEATFKQHVQEAVWLDPKMGAYVEAIRAYREQQRVADVRLPMDLKLTNADGETMTLGQLTEGKKAIYVQVWASWCGPCMRLLPELNRRGDVLADQGVAVAGMNSEMQPDQPGGDPELARQTRKEHDMQVAWLLEPEDMPFTGPLRVDSVPRGLLIAPDGRVLFNGHPMDGQLEAALNDLDATLQPDASSTS